MKRFVLIATVAVAMFVTACGGDTDAQPTTAAPASTTTTTAAPATGLPAVEACVEIMNAMAAELDLYADDANIQLDEAFGDAEPAECAFMADGPESIGLTDDEAYAALEAGLDPRLFELLSTPVPVPFEHVVDEL